MPTLSSLYDKFIRRAALTTEEKTEIRADIGAGTPPTTESVLALLEGATSVEQVPTNSPEGLGEKVFVAHSDGTLSEWKAVSILPAKWEPVSSGITKDESTGLWVRPSVRAGIIKYEDIPDQNARYVEVRGILIASSEYEGAESELAHDDDAATVWSGASAGVDWIGLDAGKSVAWRSFGYMARSGDGGTDHEAAMVGSKIQTSNDADFSTVLESVNVAGFPFAPRFEITRYPLSSNARYVRIIGDNTGYKSLSEIEAIAVHKPGTISRPVTPVISPGAGRFVSGSTTIKITSKTAGAKIYYTIDGSTPTTSSTECTGPITLTVAASTVVRAIAHDPTLSTPTSAEATRGRYTNKSLVPRSDWYDDRGILIEAHAGRVVDDRAASGYFYWAGGFANSAQKISYPDVMGTRTICLYKSTDLQNWQFVGQILGIPAGGNGVVRIHIIKKPDTGKWFLFAHGYVVDGYTGSLSIAEAEHVEGPWEWAVENYVQSGQTGGHELIHDLYPVIDESGNGWLAFTDGSGATNPAVVICRLADDWHSLTGARTSITTSGNREACVVFKRGSKWFCIHSVSNYYGTAGAFDLKYSTADALTGPWTLVGPVFESSPFGTLYEGQSSFVLDLDGAWLLGIDWWSPTELYVSRQVWSPLSFPTSSTLLAGTPNEWTPTV